MLRAGNQEDMQVQSCDPLPTYVSKVHTCSAKARHLAPSHPIKACCEFESAHDFSSCWCTAVAVTAEAVCNVPELHRFPEFCTLHWR